MLSHTSIEEKKLKEFDELSLYLIFQSKNKIKEQ